MLGLLLLIFSVPSEARNLYYDFEYGAYYESNIYHAYADSDHVGSMLNYLDGAVYYNRELSEKLEYRLGGIAEFDLYPNYSNRNKSSFGVAFNTTYSFNRRNRFEFDISLASRDKDLTDDSGQSLARTLKKTVFDVEGTYKNRYKKLWSEFAVAYSNDNYDETDVLTSYDYSSLDLKAKFSYHFSRRFKARLYLGSLKRDYKERYTYAVVTGVRAGGRLGIREYRENSVKLNLEYDFYKNNNIDLETEYTQRNENYENFYGYNQWQHKLTFTIYPARENKTKISFRFKNKDYENYHTANTRLISPFERVSIDYADFQIESEQHIGRNYYLFGFIQNYNKVSNDPDFDYLNSMYGLGIKINL